MLFCDLALARRLEAEKALGQLAHTEAFQQLYPTQGGEVLPLGDGILTYQGPDSPISRVVGLGMNGPVTPDLLAQAEAFCQERGAHTRVDVSPFSDRSLCELVGNRGYRTAWFLNVLIRPVMPEDADLATPPHGVLVRPIVPEEREMWASLVSTGFGGGAVEPGVPNIAYTNTFTRDVTCFLATVDGEPAGGGALETRNGLATCFSTSVLPTFRRRGVQTALLRARLAAAAAAGCDVVTVMTSPGSGSQRNVQRSSFQVAYTRQVMER